jgi:hypothetical protein
VLKKWLRTRVAPLFLFTLFLFTASVYSGAEPTIELSVGDSFYFDDNYDNLFVRISIDSVGTVTTFNESTIDIYRSTNSDPHAWVGDIYLRNYDYYFNKHGWIFKKEVPERFTNALYSTYGVNYTDLLTVSENINEIYSYEYEYFDPNAKSDQVLKLYYITKGYGYVFPDGYLGGNWTGLYSSDISITYEGTQTFTVNGYDLKVYKYREIKDDRTMRGSSTSYYFHSNGSINEKVVEISNDEGQFSYHYQLVEGVLTLVDTKFNAWGPINAFETVYLYSRDLNFIVSKRDINSGQISELFDFSVTNFDPNQLIKTTSKETSSTSNIKETSGTHSETKTHIESSTPDLSVPIGNSFLVSFMIFILANTYHRRNRSIHNDI